MIGLGAWWLTREHGEEEAEAESEAKAVATVETGKIVRKDLSESVTCYGNVVARPGTTQAVSVAFESRVTHLLVAPGQPVKKGDALVEIAASPATELLLRQAQSALEVAQRELKQTQERIGLKLATNQELNVAQKAATDAELQAKSFEQVGANGKEPLRAEIDGVVATVSVQDGQIVAAGAPLLEVIATDEIEVKLGVEPSEIELLNPDLEVSLVPMNQPTGKPVTGAVRLVTQRINPTTRLVDVYVSLPKESGFLLDGYVRGEVAKIVSKALVVPVAALLPEGGSFTDFSIFTIKDNKAVKHAVKVIAQSDEEAAVEAEDLAEGEEVIVAGNHELEDGGEVEVAK